ncbi:biotin-dependent carboxylase uncharacterized domain-containing protein [Marinobacter daqiaonensis]|uniref:Biotin-dependent carboxylase uncharacterized domain-containing protein n=1 Tax=Marinobacter daqiaonensis TaxID=650891 RepID=A0A1I6GU18_9GAMM|nr:biotin-dependent carboxyltransferase family protein [Marinobacter daqiaonensis]SFR45734.1 biotin-dependent carboxylase uncharacterized domain-containing protein [Marinobacter daqiaonensis]
MTGLWVDNPGPRATVQDLGRHGYQHHGLSPGGAADLHAFRWANRLLDNGPGDACLEITLGGFTATAEATLRVSLTGADCNARVNGTAVANWRTFLLKKGDRIQLGVPATGLLTYLGVTGGWRTRSFCGSRSVVAREGLAGLSPVKAGSRLPADLPERARLPDRQLPHHLQKHYGMAPCLKVMPALSPEGLDPGDPVRFIHSSYRIGRQSDRMGYRLEGPALQSDGGVVSRGVSCGTIQVPGDGKPMILMNDRQTIGGYPVLGTVPVLDCSRLAQCRPGQSVSFQWADVADCQAERQLFERLLTRTTWDKHGNCLNQS